MGAIIRSPTDIDAHVGARLRLRRRELGISQAKLGAALHITFQQIQKYELGRNRMSASTLYEVAMILDVPVGWLFDGLGQKSSDRTALAADFWTSPDGEVVLNALPKVRNREVQANIVQLIHKLADQSL
ncbi:helix-turn-helix domain-containing protein [Asticcacaulis excentricus]|uniref:helix-turn-helix domain-containing protein n=1 Tax=Asticcacaulis excentricus TaxID=78587 RepID=UPI0003229FD4|nr:helix-turn-helix transcriptional regulator [Asticcacaulis excentricus]